MKTNLKNKYKDKNPEQTIQNIKQFFEEKGYTIEVVYNKNPFPSAWWCRVVLKYKDIEIQGANGKGVNEIFALASGHAELYERYCNFSNPIYGSYINMKKLFNISYGKNGYNLFPDEVMLPVEEAVNSFPFIKEYCNAINDNNNSLLNFLKQEYPCGILSLPFKGFNVKNNVNIPFHLLTESTGSSGMAAGNSIEEALAQGLSELCEHYVSERYFTEDRPLVKLDIKKLNVVIT